MSDKKDPNQLNIEISEKIADGIYSNLAIISHSNQEFVLDFVRMMPNIPKAKVKSRIILSPSHAKRLMKALEDNIRKYEDQHGPIQDGGPSMPPINFNIPSAEA